LLTTCLSVCAMVSLLNVLYHMYFRCFARRCSTNVEFQCDERYDKYCLRYGLLASQSTLGLVDCGGRWAGDVNNATASESQLLARPRHACAGRCRLITGRQAPGRLYAVCFGFDFAWLLQRLQWL